MSLKEHLQKIWNVFTVRNSPRGQGHKPNEISEKLRMRILLLYRDFISGRMERSDGTRDDYTGVFWEEMKFALQHLYGTGSLSQMQVSSHGEDAARFVQRCTPEEFFDFIEMSFKLEQSWRIFTDENDFVEAVNSIFRMEGSPYQLTQGVMRSEPIQPSRRIITGMGRGEARIRVAYPKVIRVEDDVVYTEAVIPALSALDDPAYLAANDEFRKALDDYRRGDFEDCIAKCGSAFESTLKVLCHKNKLPFDETKDTVGPLLDKVLAHSPLDTGTFKDPLVAIGRMRNRLSAAHGGGAKVRKVERHVAQFALTGTAGAIVLLVHDIG